MTDPALIDRCLEDSETSDRFLAVYLREIIKGVLGVLEDTKLSENVRKQVVFDVLKAAYQTALKAKTAAEQRAIRDNEAIQRRQGKLPPQLES